jgi:hypothetical protein
LLSCRDPSVGLMKLKRPLTPAAANIR